MACLELCGGGRRAAAGPARCGGRGRPIRLSRRARWKREQRHQRWAHPDPGSRRSPHRHTKGHVVIARQPVEPLAESVAASFGAAGAALTVAGLRIDVGGLSGVRVTRGAMCTCRTSGRHLPNVRNGGRRCNMTRSATYIRPRTASPSLLPVGHGTSAFRHARSCAAHAGVPTARKRFWKKARAVVGIVTARRSRSKRQSRGQRGRRRPAPGRPPRRPGSARRSAARPRDPSRCRCGRLRAADRALSAGAPGASPRTGGSRPARTA